MSKTKQEHIDEIMDWFDFDRVHKVMTTLDWVWASADFGVPTQQEIRSSVRGWLSKAYDSGSTFSTGGFTYTYNKEHDFMNISFNVCEWDSYSE